MALPTAPIAAFCSARDTTGLAIMSRSSRLSPSASAMSDMSASSASRAPSSLDISKIAVA